MVPILLFHLLVSPLFIKILLMIVYLLLCVFLPSLPSFTDCPQVQATGTHFPP